MTTTNSWAGFRAAESGMCKAVQERFGAYKHHVPAPRRADGSPRLTGPAAGFHDGEMWLGMMPESRKALDLRRDPRFALHAGPGRRGAGGGRCARLGPRGALSDSAERRHHLFRVELTGAARVCLEAPPICMGVWLPGEPVCTVGGAERGASQRQRQLRRLRLPVVRGRARLGADDPAVGAG